MVGKKKIKFIFVKSVEINGTIQKFCQKGFI